MCYILNLREIKNCLIIVGPLITGRQESEVEIRIRTYSDSITSVHRGAERIEDYSESVALAGGQVVQ